MGLKIVPSSGGALEDEVTQTSTQTGTQGRGMGEGGVGMSPLAHSKPRKRLEAWGALPRPLVGTCSVQNTELGGRGEMERR